MSIYKEIILDHYHKPHNRGSLDSPDREIEVVNAVCGDKIRMMLKIDNKIITDVAFDGVGCAVSVAAASMLTDYIKGKSMAEVLKLEKEFILDMLGIELSPNRLKCALLPLEALHKTVTEVKESD